MPLPARLEERLRLPVVAAPMFLVSGPGLVVGACRAGVLGTFPALNHRTAEGFDEWCTQIEDELDGDDAPYGVNLIVHRTNERLRADLETIVRHRVPVVITSLGAASEVVEAVHSYGGVVFHDIIGLRHGRKAAEAGVDGLILVSGGAGGHAGTTNPFALLAEVRPHFGGTLLLSGCISTGADVLAAQAMGADLAYMGTRFLATRESTASDDYRQMVVDAGVDDVIYTGGVSIAHASFLRESLVRAGIDPEHPTGTTDLASVTNPHAGGEAKAWRDVWSAGQGATAVTDVPTVGDLVDRLADEYAAARARVCGAGSAHRPS